MLNDFYFALQITTPIFCILALGIIFKRIGMVTDEFAKVGSDLVFKVTLPCLLFVKLVETDFRNGLPFELIGYAIIATIVVFLFLDRFLCKYISSSIDRGVFVQGAYRSNMGIIGLAYCLSAFDEGVVATASVYLAVLTALFNILAVITLSRHQAHECTDRSYLPVIINIFKNPLIIAILIGVVVSLSRVTVPEILLSTGSYFAGMTLPLALLCAGASIRLQEFQSSRTLYWAATGKLFLVPLVITVGGIIVGFRGPELGVLFFMSASPTAAASYPMVQAMGLNHHLAAAIVAATSLGAIISSTMGIFLLRTFGLI